MRCSHEGTASARALSLGRGTVAIPEGHVTRTASGVVGSQGSPKVPDLPSSPALTDAPPSHATPTWTEAVTPSGMGRDSSKAGAHAQSWADYCPPWDGDVILPVKQLPVKGQCRL